MQEIKSGILKFIFKIRKFLNIIILEDFLTLFAIQTPIHMMANIFTKSKYNYNFL